MPDLDDVLLARGRTHGWFPDHAAITQTIKAVLYSPDQFAHGGVSDRTMMRPDLDVVLREALDMIAHKLGRIIAGDPNEPDHWVDIAGYAQLAADHLERRAEQPRPETASMQEVALAMRDQPLREAGKTFQAHADISAGFA
jgi:hypothetical protein